MDFVDVTIAGRSNEELSLLMRSNADPQPPPVFRGRLGPDGKAVVSVLPGYYVVVRPGHDTTMPLEITGQGQHTIRV